jgi:hypothetical protein
MVPPHSPRPAASPTPPSGSQRLALVALLPHLWPKGEPELRVRVVLAVACLVIAKLANVYVPFFFKGLVDALSPKGGAAVLLPLGLLLAYGGARIAAQAFSELRDGVFAKVGAAGDPAGGAADLPASPPPVAALPSRAPHRRPVARHRARHQRHRDLLSYRSSTSCRRCSRSCWSAPSCGGSMMSSLPRSPSSTIGGYIWYT